MYYKIKRDFKQFAIKNTDKIRQCENIFFDNDHEYLHKRLPEHWKKEIDNLWYNSPLSKIQDGFKTHALMDYELADLKNDHICNRNANKSYWIKSYMLSWLLNLPDKPNAQYLMSSLDRRESFRCLIKNAYELKGK